MAPEHFRRLSHILEYGIWESGILTTSEIYLRGSKNFGVGIWESGILTTSEIYLRDSLFFVSGFYLLFHIYCKWFLFVVL